MILMSKNIDNLINRISSIIKIPRLWTNEEWMKLSSLEKLFIWYKQILYIKGVGSSEVDQVSNPIKDLILYGGIILSNVSIAFLYLGIELNYFTIIGFVSVSCLIFWIINFVFQMRIGNWKDSHDLIALENEIGNKRDKFCRDIRKAAMEEPWRKAKVN